MGSPPFSGNRKESNRSSDLLGRKKVGNQRKKVVFVRRTRVREEKENKEKELRG